MAKRTIEDRAGIQSIEVGFALLEALRQASGPLPLFKVAQLAGLTASKAHRYLASFVRIGLIEQSPATGHYDLGEKALTLGLAAMQRLDLVRIAEPIMLNLTAKLGESFTLAVWADQGPTIVRHLGNMRPVVVNVRVGAVMPLLNSALGQVFVTWRRAPEIEGLVARELEGDQARRLGLRRPEDVDALRARVCAAGFAIIEGALYPGVSAIAAPVFDHTERLCAGLAVIGPDGSLDVSAGSSVTQALCGAARQISLRLGWPAP